MVLVVEVEGRRYYACGECLLVYRTPEEAGECEEYCSAHGACRVDLAARVVGRIRPYGLRLAGAGRG